MADFNPLFDMQERNAAIRSGVTSPSDPSNPASSMVATDLESAGFTGDFGSPMEAIGLSQEQLDEMQPLYLSVKQDERESLAKKGLGYALPDGSFPIRDKDDLKKAIDLRGHGSHPQIKEHLKKAAARLGATDMLPDELGGDEAINASVPEPTPELALSQETDFDKAAIVFQPHVMNLSVDTPTDDGLVWKCVCEEGTLALSPGPGQVDVEQPLNLTADLMDQLHESVQEGAFPYITIPKTHNNGLLENTGYVPVGKSEIRLSPDGRKQLWCGLDFKDEEVGERARKGLIADTSVGVKFGYRNKRTGKTYKAALEHVNLTNQPWVDGMTPFGGLSQEGVFDGEALVLSQEDFAGVFTDVAMDDIVAIDPTSEGDTLPDVTLSTTVPSMSDKQRTVEQVLAEQAAEIERLKQERKADQQALSLAQGTINSQGQQLHAEAVDKYIGDFNGKLDPAFLSRARQVMLADYGRSQGEGLKLSISTGEGKTEEAELSTTGVVKYLLSALPAKEGGDFEELMLSADSAVATTKPSDTDRLDASASADEIEREMHPERYDSEGKRKETV